MAGYDDFVEGQFDPANNFEYAGPATKTLIIASSPRSGSHMLGHVLHETGRFGHPLEYLHQGHHARWRSHYGTADTHEVLRALMRDRTSPNGVFSIKLHYPHFLALGGVNAVGEIFPDPHFVLLRRRDTVKQAVSYAIARQSGLWIGETADSTQLSYSSRAIDEALADAIAQTADWRFDLLRSGRPLLELDFEDVAASTSTSVRHIADFLGVHVPDDDIPSAPVTRRQSSPANAEWLEQYYSDAAAHGHGGVSGRYVRERNLAAKVRRILRRLGRRTLR